MEQHTQGLWELLTLLGNPAAVAALALATSNTLVQAKQNLSVFMAWRHTNNKKMSSSLLNDISWPSNSHDKPIKGAAHICRLVGTFLAIQTH